MAIYKIADLNIKIDPKYSSTLERLKPYLVSENVFDIEIINSDTEIADFAKTSSSLCTMELAESFLILNKLCIEIFENFNGFFFHSSSLMIDNEAYVFTAKSGTGKSTHTALWRKRFGDKVKMINDDKPIIRKHNGNFYIYGTPWLGKSEIGSNAKALLKAVFVLERGTENCVKRVSVGEVFGSLLEATLVFHEKDKMIRLLNMFDEFFSSTQLFKLKCNTDISAAEVAYNAVNSAKDLII